MTGGVILDDAVPWLTYVDFTPRTAAYAIYNNAIQVLRAMIGEPVNEPYTHYKVTLSKCGDFIGCGPIGGITRIFCIPAS